MRPVGDGAKRPFMSYMMGSYDGVQLSAVAFLIFHPMAAMNIDISGER